MIVGESILTDREVRALKRAVRNLCFVVFTCGMLVGLLLGAVVWR